MDPLKFSPINSGLGFHHTQEARTYPERLPSPSVPPVFASAVKTLPAEKTTFWLPVFRAFAYGMDLLINSSLCCVAFWALLSGLEIEMESLSENSFPLVLFSFLAVFNWATIAAQEVLFRSTIGKRLFSISLEGSSFRIFFRTILFHFNWVLAGIPLLLSFRDLHREAWHDRSTRVRVRQTAFP